MSHPLKASKSPFGANTTTGTTKTTVDQIGNVSQSGASLASHTFLKLTQPIDEDDYPKPRIAAVGKTYRFPFTFVVPDQLLPRSCNHHIAHPKIKDNHLQLPPSLGDPEMSGYGSTVLDDLTPAMLTIVYAVDVKLVRIHERDGHRIILAEKQHKVRITPVSYEQPPVAIDSQTPSNEYCLRAEKKIKKGLLKGRIGSVVMEAAQPPHLQLPLPGSAAFVQPTTMATVNLRFDPADDRCELPRLGVLSSRLKAHTYYSSTPFQDVPNRTSVVFDILHGVHTDAVSLSSRNMQAAPWQKHAPHTSASHVTFRRDSTTSTNTTPCPAPTQTYSAEKPFYTAQLIVPVTLPSTKLFVPTFQSCLASRCYILDLTLGVSVPGGTPGAGTTLHLKVPVQLTSGGNMSTCRSSSNEETAFDTTEIDEYFTPRSTSTPWDFSRLSQSEEGRASSELPAPPPEYSHSTQPLSRRQRLTEERGGSHSWFIAATALTMVR